MGLALPRGCKCHFLGDSRTVDGWWYANGALLDQLRAAWQALDAATGPTIAPRYDLISAGRAPGAQGVRVTQSGVSGNKLIDIAPNLAARFTPFAPDVCFCWVGINDVIAGTNPATFQAMYLQMLKDMRTAIPGVQIVVMSDPCYGEQWVNTNPLTWFLTGTTGPNFGLNPQIQAAATDPSVVSYVTYVELSGPYLTYESTHNPPAGAGGADAGILMRTGDVHGLHPNSTAGQPYISSTVMGALTLS